MYNAETRALLWAILDEVCEHVDQYQTATRAHVAAQILAAAGRKMTFEDSETPTPSIEDRANDVAVTQASLLNAIGMIRKIILLVSLSPRAWPFR